MPTSELLAYVSEQKDNGTPSDHIYASLISIGWTHDEARAAIDYRPSVSRTKKSFFRVFLKVIIACFAFVGIGLVGAYAAVRFKVTNTTGIIDTQASSFWQQADISNATAPQSAEAFFNTNNYCLLKVLKSDYQGEFRRVTSMALGSDTKLATDTLDALSTTLTTPQQASLEACREQMMSAVLTRADFEKLADLVDTSSPFAWQNSPDWDYFKTVVTKDQSVINRVSQETGIPSRVIVGELAAEQMRLFNSERGWFKSFIAPLKVLGSMTKFSWGVMGVKEETAQTIENSLTDPTSVFYPGLQYEHLLDFKTQDKTQERFARITNAQDHYYAYLYAGLFDREMIAQWQKSGFDISQKPGVLATLFNIGFNHSEPNANPQLGGADITVGGEQLSFGRLAYEFYYSDQLLNEFPLESLHK